MILGITQKKLKKLVKTVDRECCNDPVVFTQDSESVNFSGAGTENDPLIATAVGGGVVTENSETIAFSGDGTADNPLTAESVGGTIPSGLTPLGTAGQILRVNTTEDGLEYSTHANGVAITRSLQGALVPDTVVFNASGHVTTFTQRTLLATDIEAVPEDAVNVGVGWNVGYSAPLGARIISSAVNGPTTDLWTGIFMPGTSFADGSQIALRDGQMWIRTRNNSVTDTWRQVVIAPAPPASGTFVLTSTDGVLSWEVNAA